MLAAKREAIDALPDAFTGGRPLAAELAEFDVHHDGLGGAVWFITEAVLRQLDCRLCDHRTMGKLPEGLSARAFGPTVDAVVAVLMGVYRLTKRQVPELRRDVSGLQMSVGAVIGCQEAASAAIAQTVEDAQS